MEPFVHLPQHRVVICKRCRFACVANEVPAHLRTRHADVPVAERHAIARAVQQLPDIIRTQEDLAGFEFPPPTSEAIPFLGPSRPDGLKCRHARKVHGWHNPLRSGRPPAGPGPLPLHDVELP
ncbi:hypothetical protein N657DRAFT_648938 [Parathielavia appendiculata]|uniref:Uncharacterized protein n=1 Tax=Parathielavia appendiculata TaxID=2587402 RepID=A0AAN6Z0J9_9PEZI|nr:hypothetical protein N657DRAFT_648938 [Parathielavia appendiculata]